MSAEAEAFATIRELGKQLAAGSLTDRELVAIRTRRNRLRDEWGDPPDEPQAAPVAPVELAADDVEEIAAEEIELLSRAALWAQLGALNVQEDSDGTTPLARDVVGATRARVARKLGLPA